MLLHLLTPKAPRIIQEGNVIMPKKNVNIQKSFILGHLKFHFNLQPVMSYLKVHINQICCFSILLGCLVICRHPAQLPVLLSTMM